MRLDVAVFAQGLAESRQKAQLLIDAGCVFVQGKPIRKASFAVSDDAEIHLEGKLPLPYVGRGGLKLEGALREFGISPSGLIAADIGASTGGFTDCLLQNGAKKVYAIDSGREQLHPSLRADPRVVSMEECNAKTLSESLLGERVDLAVMDVSFTSQTVLYAAINAILKPDGMLISLIKPQFEVGKSGIGKKGIVRDPKQHFKACSDVLDAAEQCGLFAQNFMRSPILGGDGNAEFIALFSRILPRKIRADEMKKIVYQ